MANSRRIDLATAPRGDADRKTPIATSQGGGSDRSRWLLLVFLAVSAVTLAAAPWLLRFAIRHFGHRVSEPEIKLLLVVLLGLGGLATQAGSEAVLPAYVAGLVIAGMFLRDRMLMDRLRSIAFALLTPFFFLRAGTLISAPALMRGAGVGGRLAAGQARRQDGRRLASGRRIQVAAS